MNHSIEQLEIKVAFLEQANGELSQELYRQRQELEALRAQLAVLLERLEAAQSESTSYSEEQEKPPHY